MSETKTAGTDSKLGVWFKYRAANSDTVHTFFCSGVVANRYIRRLLRKQRYGHAKLDYFHVEGAYESQQRTTKPVISERITIRRNAPVLEEASGFANLVSIHKEIPSSRKSRVQTQHMAFHASVLASDVLIWCPYTGIFGKLEMPALPVALTYQHPLSIPDNALSVIKAWRNKIKEQRLFKPSDAPVVSEQVWAGILLSLLGKKGKNLVSVEDESTAAERNMVLQSAGYKVLWSLCDMVERMWNNPNVWNKMPRLSLQWKTHAKVPMAGHTNVAQTLQNYEKIMMATLEPLSLSEEDQARYFKAQQVKQERGRVPSYIKVYSASAVQARNIKDSKTEARELFDTLKPHLSIAQRTLVEKTLRQLLLLPQDAKTRAANTLRLATLNGVQKEMANKLATMIESAKTDKIMEEIGSVMQEMMPVRSKSIAEILARKRKEDYTDE